MTRKNRVSVNLLIELATFITLLGMIATGLVMKFVLPFADSDLLHRGWAVWGWGRHHWGNAHFYLAMSAVALLMVHWAIHWNWLCHTVYRRFHGPNDATEEAPPVVRHGYGVIFVMVVILVISGFFIAAGRGLRTEVGAQRDMPPHAKQLSSP